MNLNDAKIGIIGLGYVGLPLAVAFGKVHSCVGFDIDAARVQALIAGEDWTLEVTEEELAEARQLVYSSDPESLRDCTVYIVAVPTPIDNSQRPDLTPLLRASELVGRLVSHGDVVIYESTVYPGATEEDCVPVIERISGLKLNIDFFVGYSPERVNPGDRARRLPDIKKLTSGSTPEAAEFVDALYRMVVKAGTFKAASIRVAEAAKVIENTQRDVNIALINEFAQIFGRLGIDTADVLEAAGTKWNFLSFRPGMVGGHCIGVDPYYLAHKARLAGMHPEMVLAGRRINDTMGEYIANQLVREMIHRGHRVKDARVLVLGVTFKENCPDCRNSGVVKAISALEAFGLRVDVIDPWANPEHVADDFGLTLVEKPETGAYDAALLAVAHGEYVALGREGISEYLALPDGVIYDVKSVLERAPNIVRV